MIRFGISLGAAGEGRDPRSMAELAALAEAAGWDGIFLEDYIVYQGQIDMPTYDPWVVLAAMASVTSRVRLGTTVTPLPRRRPWKLASEAVSLDHLSAGRVILGVGAGDVADPAFTAVHEPVAARVRAQLLDEALEIVAGLWTGRPVRYQGAHYSVEGLRLAATPVQQPRIPIWVGGDWLAPGVRRRVSRWDGACVYKGRPGAGVPMTPNDVGDILSLVADERGSADGFDVKVGGDRDLAQIQAFAEAGATWWNEWIPPGDRQRTRAMIANGPPRLG